MTNPTPSAGDPIEEPQTGDTDVVERAREALAEAESARREAVVDPEPSAAPHVETTPEFDAVVESDPVVITASEPVASASPSDDLPWYDRPDDVPYDDGATPVAAEDVVVDEVVVEQTITPSEPAAEPTVAPGLLAASAQPIFVQAPEAPRPRGNRGAAAAIGLVATLAFAVAFFVAIVVVALIYRTVEFDGLAALSLRVLGTWAFWVPIVVFYLAFVVLGAFINRARWGHWVVWGLLVGLASYGGYLLGQLFQAPFWQLTGDQGARLLEEQSFAPLAIIAFILGRELTIWFGAWVARRGRRVTELNAESLREYERTLEAGPQLLRP